MKSFDDLLTCVDRNLADLPLGKQAVEIHTRYNTCNRHAPRICRDMANILVDPT